MTLVDNKKRTLELGQRVRVEENISSVNGMLYKNSLVKLDEIRVTDSLGKIWWISPTQVSCSFL